MSEIDNNSPAKRPAEPRESPGKGSVKFHYEVKGNRVVGPLIGCPIMIFLIFFILLLTIIAFFLSLFGGRKSAELIMKRVAKMRDSSGSGNFGGSEDEIIDVDGEVIDPPDNNRD